MKFLSPINVNTEYTLPFVDGTNGQVLTTDGNGAVYWGSVSVGATNLNALTDVELTTPTSGQILRYELPPGGEIPIWRNVTPNYLTPNSSINALVDVTISSPAVGQLLRWNGTYWLNWTPDFLTAHPTITNGGSVNNSLGTVVQDITVDANGHVTAIGSVNLDNRYYTQDDITAFFGGDTAIAGYNLINWDAAYADKINSASFSTTTGVLTLTQQDTGTITVDLDGRYLQSFTETDPTVPAHVKSITATNISNWNDAFNDSIRSAAFNTTNGVLTLTQVDLGTVTVDLDGRYLETFTETDPTVPVYVKAITETQIGDWDRAYNWGNHADAGYAPVASPTFTGTPSAPTAAAGTNTTQIATTAFVQTAVSNLVDAAPATLDTLNELAAALGDDPNFATTVTNSIATKVPATRTLTINGTAFDLSANRSWTIDSADGYVSDVRLVESTLSFSGEGNAFSGSVDLSTLPFQPVGSYLTAEADTLASVTGRGASTSTAVTFNGGVNLAADIGIRKAGDNWIIGYSTSLPGIAIGSGTPTDKVSISSGGTQRVWFDTNGNVGIGTANPSYKLDVSGQFRVNNGVGNGSGQALIVGGSGDVTLTSGGSLFFGAYDYAGSTYIRGYDNSAGLYLYADGYNIARFGSTSAQIDKTLILADDISFTKTNVSIYGNSTGFLYFHGYSNVYFQNHIIARGGISNDGGDVFINNNLYINTDTARIYFNRPGGVIVGSIGWHSDDYFYVAGHPSYGPGAGNDVRVWGFGQNIHFGTNSAGDVATINNAGTFTYGGSEIATRTWVQAQGYLTSETDSQTLDWDGASKNLSITNGNTVTLDGLATEEFVTSQGYITGYTETDTLASVTGRGASTTNAITVGGATINGTWQTVISTGGGWNKLSFVASNAWGDGTTYGVLGAGGGAEPGVMTYNQHATWVGSSNGAGIRMGRSGGVASGAWYQVATMDSDEFMIAKNGQWSNGGIKITSGGELQHGNSGNKYWHAGNDGSGSGLDADLLDGVNGASFLRNDVVGAGVSGTIISTNNANVDGSNFTVDTVNKTVNEYAYKVSRSGSAVGGILIDGRGVFPSINVNGASVTSTTVSNWNTAYGWGNNYISDVRLQESILEFTGQGSAFTGNIDLSGLPFASSSHTHSASDITSGTLSTDRLPKQELGISIVGNFGQWQAHSAYQNLNTDVAYWGWNFVQGSTNAPHQSSSQWYRGRFSLGDEYGLGTSPGDYWMEIAIPRYNQGDNAGNLFVRTCENGSINAWQGVRAAFATDADTLDGNHASAFALASHTHAYLPLSGGTLSGTLSMSNNDINDINSIYINDPGAGEGINWNGGSGWGIFECPDVFDNTGGNLQFALNASERMMTLDVSGNLWVAGTYTEASSIRFKENITPLDPALDKVNQLEAVSYNKIGADDREIGLIAEDVAELFPEVVTYNEEGQPQGIQYQRLSVILLKAVQELTERVNKLENK